MNHITSRPVLAGLAGLTLAAGAAVVGATATAGSAAIHARAEIVDTAHNPIGFASFAEDAVGVVHVNVKVSGLPSGLHGTHIHAIGNCGGDFSGAGGHFNPGGTNSHGEHTRGEHAAHHAGDLPNLVVNDDQQGHLNTASAHFTLSHDAAESLFDGDGSAIIIHAKEDDFTLPLGNSGARSACGVIVEV